VSIAAIAVISAWRERCIHRRVMRASHLAVLASFVGLRFAACALAPQLEAHVVNGSAEAGSSRRAQTPPATPARKPLVRKAKKTVLAQATPGAVDQSRTP
jgi:hypothetical protein